MTIPRQYFRRNFIISPLSSRIHMRPFEISKYTGVWRHPNSTTLNPTGFGHAPFKFLGMWEFRGFAELHGLPRLPGHSCDQCKSEEKISAFIEGVGLFCGFPNPVQWSAIVVQKHQRAVWLKKSLIAIEVSQFDTKAWPSTTRSVNCN